MEKGKIQETSDGLGSSTCAKILPEGGKSASLFFLTYSWGPRSSQGMMMTQTCQPSCAIPQGEFRGEELPPPPPVDLLDINLVMGLKKSHLFKQHCKYHFCFSNISVKFSVSIETKTRPLIGRFGIDAGKQSKQMILHFLQICLCAKKILLKNWLCDTFWYFQITLDPP